MWIIETWMGRHVFTDQTFETFEEARGFISDYAETEAGDDEDTYNGICEDLYAVQAGKRVGSDA
jgi:hypothetical protein